MISEKTARMTGNPLDKENFDTSVSPAADFYTFACGGWQKENPIPADKTRFGTFTVLRERAKEQLKNLITSLSSSPEAKIMGTDAQKISDVYSMFMDEEHINATEPGVVMRIADEIRAFDRKDMFRLSGTVGSPLFGSLFGFAVSPDLKDSDVNTFIVGECGIFLGDRDYYLEDNEHHRKILEAYEKYILRLLGLCGLDETTARRMWETNIRVEREFARHKMTREERRNPENRYHPTTRQELRDRYPAIGWDEMFEALGLQPEVVNVISPGFMTFFNEFYPSLSDTELHDLLVLNWILANTSHMGEKFDEAELDFIRVMYGAEQLPARWERAVGVLSMFGEVIGKLYVAKYFPPSHKERMLRLVGNLRKALGDHISSLPWMSDATKEKALGKLAALKVKIGYPDKWKDYSTLLIDPSKSFTENLLAASQWYIRDNLSQYGKPVDKEEWHMFPQTVNAYYSPLNNEICFPAAILQPPYFSPDFDDALNYGGIGVVIGHEMTHGFDDQGRKFDKDGNMQEWWTEHDKQKFDELAAILVRQFDAVEVAPGVHANGTFTLGENIADQGGLRVALTAYKESCGGMLPDNVIDGFTALQRFYIAYAHVWAQNTRPEDVLDGVKTDPHSLGINRVNVTLRNIEPFFDAFSIKEGDPLFREESDRVIIW